MANTQTHLCLHRHIDSLFSAVILFCTLTVFVSGTALSPTQPYEQLVAVGAAVVAMPQNPQDLSAFSSGSSVVVPGLKTRDSVSPPPSSSSSLPPTPTPIPSPSPGHRDWTFVTEASQCELLEVPESKIDCLEHVIQLMQKKQGDTSKLIRLLKDGLMLSLGIVGILFAVCLLLIIRNCTLQNKAEQLDSLPLKSLSTHSQVPNNLHSVNHNNNNHNNNHNKQHKHQSKPSSSNSCVNGYEEDRYYTRGFQLV